MMRRFGLMLACAAALAYGCSDDDGPPDASTDDAAMDATADTGMDADTPDECTGGETYLYVLDRLGAGNQLAIEDGIAPGFDLDGLEDREDNPCPGPPPDFPGGQGTRDPWNPYFEWPEDDPTPGINNGLLASFLGTLLPGMIDNMVPEAIMNAEILVLAKLDHVEDFTNDDCVEASLLLGAIPASELPDPDEVSDDDYLEAVRNYLNPDWEQIEGEDETPRPISGLTFDVIPESFDEEGNPLVFDRGRISNGQLEFEQDGLSLDLGALALTLGTARLGFSPTAETLEDGLLGGDVPIAALVDLLSEFLDTPPTEEQMRVYADLGYDEEADACFDISVGFTFQAVDAVLGEILEPEEPEADAGVDAGTDAAVDAGDEEVDAGDEEVDAGDDPV